MIRSVALILLFAPPLALAGACAAFLLLVLAGRDPLLRIPILELDQPLHLSHDERAGMAIRVYELLSRGVGPNDPLLFTHPVTTRGQELQVGLLYVAAGEDDQDLIRLIIDKGADLSLPINAAAVCAAIAASNTERARILLEEHGMSPNPMPRCLADSLSPLALAEQLDYPDDARALLLRHGAMLQY